jgi:hypothetical protein
MPKAIDTGRQLTTASVNSLTHTGWKATARTGSVEGLGI